MNPLVYIIVLTWNGKKDTIECLNSLRRVKYPNFKVLVVDNASSDGTEETIKLEFDTIEYIKNKENLRFAGGNNVGIEYSLCRNADYILLLNNDTIVDEYFLNELIITAESDPQIGMVGPKIYYYSERNRIWYAGGRIDWGKGWISHNGIRELDNKKFYKQQDTDYISGCCILVKTEVIRKVGMLDTSFYIYGEDVDWCIRAVRAGYRLIFEPKAKIWHKLSVSTGGHLSWFKNWNKLKSQLRIMYKYAKWYHWLLIPGMLIIYIIFSFIKFSLYFDRTVENRYLAFL